MTEEEFIIRTKKLEDYFGKDLNITQRKMWFEELKHYDVNRYEKAINFLCMTSRYRPLLNEVIEAVKTCQISAEEREKIPCKYCGGTGYFMYKKIENGYPYEYACLCICQNADGLEYNGSKIADKEHRSKFYIKSAREVFGDRLPSSEKNQEQPQQRDIKNLISSLTDQMTF